MLAGIRTPKYADRRFGRVCHVEDGAGADRGWWTVGIVVPPLARFRDAERVRLRLAGYMVLAVVLLLFTWWNGLNQRSDGTEEFGDLLLGHRRQVVDCHLLRRNRNPTQINAGRMDAKSDERRSQSRPELAPFKPAVFSKTWTFFDGDWHDGNAPIMGARTHAAWLGSMVFDGARAFEGVTPDLDLHCARVNRSAENFLLQATVSVDTWDEFKAVFKDQDSKFVMAHWDGTGETEEKIKELTKATIRCIPLNNEQEEGKCILTGKPSKERVLFARAY